MELKSDYSIQYSIRYHNRTEREENFFYNSGTQCDVFRALWSVIWLKLLEFEVCSWLLLHLLVGFLSNFGLLFTCMEEKTDFKVIFQQEANIWMSEMETILTLEIVK